MTVSAYAKEICQFIGETRAITLKPHYVFCVRPQRSFTFLLDSRFFQSVFPPCSLPPFFFLVRKLIVCSSPTSAPLAEPGAMCIIMMNHKLLKKTNQNNPPPQSKTKKPIPKHRTHAKIASTSHTLGF